MAKSKRKSLLPKRIAGVKVPKSVRKGRFGDFLASRTGQALLAEAIMAAGAVGVAKHAKGGSDENAPGKSGPHADGVVADALRRWQNSGDHHGQNTATATIAYALGEAARTFVQALNERRVTHGHGGMAEFGGDAAAPDEGYDDDDHSAAAYRADGPDDPRGLKKKPASWRADPS